MKLYIFLISLLVATVSGIKLRGASPDQENFLETGRDLQGDGFRHFESTITLKGGSLDGDFSEANVFCTDPDDPSSTLSLWDFIWIDAEKAASNYFDDYADMSGIPRNKMRFHMDSTPISLVPASRRLSGSGFFYRTNAGCRYCDDDESDGRRRLEGMVLSDYLARKLQKNINDACEAFNVAEVNFDML